MKGTGSSTNSFKRSAYDLLHAPWRKYSGDKTIKTYGLSYTVSLIHDIYPWCVVNLIENIERYSAMYMRIICACKLFFLLVYPFGCF